MDYSEQLAISYYKTIATLNKEHKIYLVQHLQSHKIYVKKILDVYNKNIYKALFQKHIIGTPNIIEIFEDNNQLIVIESYISGLSLQDIIDNTSSIDINYLYNYAIELCSIVDMLHSFNPPIIHRDIKPSNIIITEYNHVVLLDFNAAKYYNSSATNDTTLIGTHGYAAPEQYGFGSSTPKTDIYSIGVLLKELASALPAIPSHLNNIITKCMQINPNDRFDSVSDLINVLQHYSKHNIKLPQKPFSIKSLLPPGYRTFTFWKMAVATPMYIFIFWTGLSLNSDQISMGALWIERIFFLLMMLSVIFGCFNYLDIQQFLPLCKHRLKVVRYIGIFILNAIIVSTLFITMFSIEALFFL